MNESVIVPLKQAVLTIAGQRFIAVLLPDGQHGLVLSMLCGALGLHTHKQAQRLRAHGVLAAALVLVRIDTPGGPQIGNVLLSWGIPLWVAGIKPGWRSPEYLERLLIIQRDVAAALARLFFQPPPAPTQVTPTTPEVLPAGVDLSQQELLRELIATERLLAASIERVVEHEVRLGHLEHLHRPRRAKRRGRPRKHSS